VCISWIREFGQRNLPICRGWCVVWRVVRRDLVVSGVFCRLVGAVRCRQLLAETAGKPSNQDLC